MIILQLTSEQLKDIVQDAVRETLTQQIPAPAVHVGNPSQRMDVKEAAAYIKRARQTVYDLVSKRQIPHGRTGKNLWFIQSELDSWLDAGRRKTVKDLQEEAEQEFITKKKRG